MYYPRRMARCRAHGIYLKSAPRDIFVLKVELVIALAGWRGVPFDVPRDILLFIPLMCPWNTLIFEMVF